ncbi:GNAT family N-acetyltransferase [Tersicoccus sp. MR15.9]|uniref:GNAT family N-acetyltransferase n=1 Tax=Tersicoccus mangrovi TaxID=3121635 RepID=UPI002FE5CEE3
MIATLDLPAELTTPVGPVTLRRARPGDLDAVMALLADDPVSASRGDRARDADRPQYAAALAGILADPSNDLLVAVTDDDAPVATMQLTLIPGMARRGASRLQVEAVRVASARRSGGIGGALMQWVIGPAVEATGAGLVQLTSDAARADAHRFYERLGFAASHVGFKYRVG